MQLSLGLSGGEVVVDVGLCGVVGVAAGVLETVVDSAADCAAAKDARTESNTDSVSFIVLRAKGKLKAEDRGKRTSIVDYLVTRTLTDIYRLRIHSLLCVSKCHSRCLLLLGSVLK